MVMYKKKKVFDLDIETAFQIQRELVHLVNILRDEKYEETCMASNHTLLLCTHCNSNATDAVRRIKTYGGGN